MGERAADLARADQRNSTARHGSLSSIYAVTSGREAPPSLWLPAIPLSCKLTGTPFR
jgi:hypothetical protein